MASSTDRILVRIEARIDDLERDLRRAEGSVRRSMNRIEDSTRNASRAVDQMRGALIALATSAGAVFLKNTADAATELNNRMKLATKSVEDHNRAMEESFRIAQDTRTGYKEVGLTFVDLERSTRELGLGQSRLFDITEGVAQSLAIVGGNSESAAAGLFQFNQGLAAGVLRGQEYNSVLEQLPRLALAIADGFGVGIGQLRLLANEGFLTTERVITALESQLEVLNKEFKTAASTIGGAFTTLNNALIKTVGEIDRSVGITAALTSAIRSLAENMDTVVRASLAMIATGVAAYMAKLAIAVLRSVASFTALNAIMRANPLLLIASSVIAATAAIVAFSDKVVNIGGQVVSVGALGKGAFEVVKNAASDALDDIVRRAKVMDTEFSRIFGTGSGSFVDDVETAFGVMLDAAKSWVSNTVNFVYAGFSALGAFISNFFESIAQSLDQWARRMQAIGTDFLNFNFFSQPAYEAELALQSLEGKVGSSADAMKREFKDAFDADVAGDLADAIERGVGGAIDFATGKAQGLKAEILSTAAAIEAQSRGLQLALEREKSFQTAFSGTGGASQAAKDLQTLAQEALAKTLGKVDKAAAGAASSVKQLSVAQQAAAQFAENYVRSTIDLIEDFEKRSGTIEFRLGYSKEELSEFKRKNDELEKDIAEPWAEAANQIAITFGNLFVELGRGTDDFVSSMSRALTALGASLAEEALKALEKYNINLSEAQIGVAAPIIGAAGTAAQAQGGAIGILGGAATGALTGFAASGGNIYAAVAGAFIGGITAALSSGGPVEKTVRVRFESALREGIKATRFERNSIFGGIDVAKAGGLDQIDGNALASFLNQVVQLDNVFASFATDSEIDAAREQVDGFISEFKRMTQEGFELDKALELVAPRFERISNEIAVFSEFGADIRRAFESGSPENVNRTIQEIVAFSAAMEGLGLTAEQAKELLFDAQRGNEALLQTYERLYSTIFSEEEQRAQVIAAAEEAVAKYNREVGTSIKTLDDLYAYAKTIDLTTEAGRNALEELSNLKDSLLILADSAEVAAEEVAQLANGLTEAANAVLEQIKATYTQFVDFTIGALQRINQVGGYFTEFEFAIHTVSALIGQFTKMRNAGFSAEQQLAQLNKVLAGLDAAYRAGVADIERRTSAEITRINEQLRRDIEALREASEGRIAGLEEEAALIRETTETRVKALQEELEIAQQWESVLSSAQSAIANAQFGGINPLSEGEQLRLLQNRVAGGFSGAEGAARSVEDLERILEILGNERLFQRGDPGFEKLYNDTIRQLRAIEQQAQEETDRANQIQEEILSLQERQAEELERISKAIETEQNALEAAIKSLETGAQEEILKVEQKAAYELEVLNAAMEKLYAIALETGQVLYNEILAQQAEQLIAEQKGLEIAAYQVLAIVKLTQLIAEIAGVAAPSYQSGIDYVPRTGPAFLHAGERVIPAGQNQGGAVVNLTMPVTVHGGDAQQIKMVIREEINRSIPAIQRGLRFAQR